ncbi:hypothetical protein T07_7660 [Trichinella nelsoni]|uniref:Uncharacterized protein n=1 Tax=Trichinella nelsoni TaxID=6336 RepID=A0A0V0RK75_9BILA|nr:hypothetical protein T07_7660 [Trichinella nelsoni]
MNWKIHASSGKNPAKCFSLSPLAFAPVCTLVENSALALRRGYTSSSASEPTVARPVMNKKLVMFFTRKEEDIKTGLNWGRKQLSMKFTVAWWGEADMGSN